ncbi:uncharacterized protein [Spinacia oleracea]|uniref:RNase H type-1 domain-containing protein n=1 Tax=Spinacia oleracea TaxID=3562 RepID=A0A9R0JWC4_SPIOL|nr:uncharacterized protein LOC110789129 [Spinacia oleracea]
MLDMSPFNDWVKSSLLSNTTGRDNIPLNVSFAFGLWAIWKRRNAWCFSRNNIPIASTYKHSSWAALEWFYTQNLLSKEEKPTPPKWSPPPVGFIKINSDAAFVSSSSISGLAAVARNHLGVWLEGRVSACYAHDAYMAELVGIKEALSWAEGKGWDHCIFATDSSNAVTDITNVSVCNSRYNSTIGICRAKLDRLQDSTLIFEGRPANMVADLLAKKARNKFTLHSEVCFYQSPTLDCIKLLADDVPENDSINRVVGVAPHPSDVTFENLGASSRSLHSSII